MNNDNYYWMFSAAAQSIAALIAFLLAGVTLAFTIMDRVIDQDPTLYDVIDSLRNTLHREMSALAISTGLAIILSLTATFVNPYQGNFRLGVMILAGVVDVTTIVLAIYFVIQVISPRRYAMAARKAFKESTGEVLPSTPQAPSSSFFHSFISLEQDIREYLQSQDMFVQGAGEGRILSFRQMVNALYQNERISPQLRDMLFEIGKYRNLLFHGHIDQVGEDIVKKLTETTQQWMMVKNAQQLNTPDPRSAGR